MTIPDGGPTAGPEPADLAFGAFSSHPPWVLDLDRPVAGARASTSSGPAPGPRPPGSPAGVGFPPGPGSVRVGVVAGHGPGRLVRPSTAAGASTVVTGRAVAPAAPRPSSGSGPTYIKLGQILSSGEGIFPEELVAEFRLLPRPGPGRALRRGARASSRPTWAGPSSERLQRVRPHAHRGGLDRPGPRGARCAPASAVVVKVQRPTWPRWCAATSPP